MGKSITDLCSVTIVGLDIDFVLDNLSDDIRPWSATGYQFYKRQAQDDPNVWLSLGGATGAEPGTAAPN
jgi:hypothetical protein